MHKFQRSSRSNGNGSTGNPRKIKGRLTVLVLFTCLAFWPSWIRGQNGERQPGAATGQKGPSQRVAHAEEELLPLGAAPPPGKKWQLQANDDFDKDASIREELWNGGTGGGMPEGFCGTVATSCGYTGNDCKSYFGTYPDPPYAAIERGRGLTIQATHAAPGDQKYYDNKMADIQSYGKITIHPGSFVEWVAKMPTDQHGEGDGWHVDLWCAPMSRHRCDDSAEVDVAEKVLSVANSGKATYVIHDQPVGPQTPFETMYSAPDGSDLSARFHTYGLFWHDDHLGKEGSIDGYIDGKLIADHPVPITDPSWESGAYCYAGWMQQAIDVFGGGEKFGPNTSLKDPLVIKRFTVWQAK